MQHILSLRFQIVCALSRPQANQLNRLITQIKGVGDPLVSSYLRCYAAKKVVTLLRKNSEDATLKTLLGDFVSRYIAISDLDESVSEQAERIFSNGIVIETVWS